MTDRDDFTGYVEKISRWTETYENDPVAYSLFNDAENIVEMITPFTDSVPIEDLPDSEMEDTPIYDPKAVGVVWPGAYTAANAIPDIHREAAEIMAGASLRLSDSDTGMDQLIHSIAELSNQLTEAHNKYRRAHGAAVMKDEMANIDGEELALDYAIQVTDEYEEVFQDIKDSLADSDEELQAEIENTVSEVLSDYE